MKREKRQRDWERQGYIKKDSYGQNDGLVD